MTAEQKLLAAHFEKCGAKVEFQRFQVPYPLDGPDDKLIGRDVPMANLIVRWNPENRERVMICGHYDTLPFPLRDPVNKRGRFLGANDNGSGVALLMELGNEFAREPPKIGVDFVFFDGEEFIFGEDGKFFWGSEHFAEDYARHPPAFRYRSAVLLDMVGGSELALQQDALECGLERLPAAVEGNLGHGGAVEGAGVRRRAGAWRWSATTTWPCTTRPKSRSAI